MALANNTRHDLKLHSTLPGQGKDSCTPAEGRTPETLVVKGYSALTVPYSWLCEGRTVWIATCKDDKTVLCVLVSDLLNLYKVDPESVNFKDLVTSTIPLVTNSDKDRQPVYLTCNVAVFKCHRISKATPYQFLLSFDAPLVVHNYLPHPLEVRCRSESLNERRLGMVKSQEAFETCAVDGENFKSTRMIWKVHADANTQYVCDTWAATLKINETSEDRLKFLINTQSKQSPNQGELQLEATIRPNLNLTNPYYNFALREKVFENCASKKIVIYGKYAIVNRTDRDIMFSHKSKHEQEIKAHNSCLCDLGDKSELQFKVKGYSNVLCDL